MQNFGKNVSKMQHYGPGLHLFGHEDIGLNKGPDIVNSGGNL